MVWRNIKLVISEAVATSFENVNNTLDDIKSLNLQAKSQIHNEVEGIDHQESKEFDLEKILGMIKFDPNPTQRSLSIFKQCLNDLRVDQRFLKIGKGQFAAIAFVFLKTGWIKSDPDFEPWLEIFSKCFNRPTSTYKPNSLKKFVSAVERKFPYLNELPTRK